MSWCGYAGFEPWRKNDCRHYPVLNYESILYLRNAVCAGRLSEIHSTDLQFNAFFNLAQALFKCRDACKCPECMVVPLDDMLNLSEEMATAELEHVFEQIGRCVSSIDDFRESGFIPRDIATQMSFHLANNDYADVVSSAKQRHLPNNDYADVVSSAKQRHLPNNDYVDARELLSPSTPDRAMAHLKKHYVGVLLNMKKGLPDVAERHIKDLLEYVTVLTTPPPTVTRSSVLTTHVVDPENISNISESQSAGTTTVVMWGPPL
jgi:hypothetical protein